MITGKSLSPVLYVVLGAIVFVVSMTVENFVDTNFIIFKILGCVMFVYGIVRFFILKLKTDESIEQNEARLDQSIQQELHPNQGNYAGNGQNSQYAQNNDHGYQVVGHTRQNSVDPTAYRNLQTDDGFQTSSAPMSFCPSCGGRVGSSNFCPTCGAKVR